MPAYSSYFNKEIELLIKQINKMIIVKVTYTVKPEFVLQNQENIHLFIKDFQKINNNDFRYSAYVCEDGKTFVHLSMYKNEETQKKLLNAESFKLFQQQRDSSGLEISPKVDVMKLVASSNDLFS